MDIAEMKARLQEENDELNAELADPEITALRADNQVKKEDIARREATEKEEKAVLKAAAEAS